MWVTIENTTKSLNKGDRSRLAVLDAKAAAAQALEGEERAEKGVEHVGEMGSVHGERKAKGPGQGQDPLAVGRLRQDAVHEVGGNAGCSPRGARRAQSTFTRKCHKPLKPTSRATKPGKTSAEDAAAEEAIELIFDKPRIAGARLAEATCLIEKGLEVLADHAVEIGLLRLMSLVRARQRCRARARRRLVDDGGQRGVVGGRGVAGRGAHGAS